MWRLAEEVSGGGGVAGGGGEWREFQKHAEAPPAATAHSPQELIEGFKQFAVDEQAPAFVQFDDSYHSRS